MPLDEERDWLDVSPEYVQAAIDRMHLPDPGPLTLEQLVEREPRIGPILERALHDGEPNVWVAYSRYKQLLFPLVGWERTDNDPILCSRRAYDIVIQALSRALGV